jgi:WD40 repeat protein
VKYWAFVSYSHTDKAWGDWLHKALETYRVPRRLVGKKSRDGTIPPRLFPIFRDREELPVSADLSSNITEALSESRYLIVVCSPRSAKSRWVGEEIKTFKRLGRENRILALIVDGEPNASDEKPGFKVEDECFHEAMRYRWSETGERSDIRTEPIAADAREGKDGRNNAKLKLIAGLLGVNYDEIRQREQERRLQRARRIGIVALGLVAIFAGLTIWATLAAREAARQKRQTQRLLVASDSVRAQELFDRGDAATAVAFLARAVESDPDPHSVAAERLWFALTERAWPVPIGIPMIHRDGLTSVCFSPDGKTILTASRDTTARLWDALSGKPIGQPLTHQRQLRRALFLSGTPYVLTVCTDGLVRVGDPKSGALLPKREIANPDTINSIAVSAGGKYFATGSVDGTIRVWDSKNFSQACELHQAENVHTLAFHPSDETLLLSVSGKTAALWRVPDAILRFECKHEDEINAAAFDSRGSRILTASNDRACRLWDATTGKFSDIELRHDVPVINAFFSPDGDRLASIAGTRVWVWQLQNPVKLEQKLEHDSAVTCAAFSNDGLAIFTGTHDGKDRQWNVRTGKLVGEPIQENSAVIAMEVARGSGALVLGTAGGTARVWRPARRFPIADRLPHVDSIESIIPSPDGRALLTACDDGNARLWDLSNTQSPQKLLHHRAAVLAGAFNPEGSTILTGGADARARSWQTKTGNAIGAPIVHPATVVKVAFRPDGKAFATATETGRAQFWDAQTQQPIGQAMPHEPHISAMQFSRDGKIFMTAGWDGKIRLWNSLDARPTGKAFGGDKEITCAVFSPRGDIIATGHRDGAVNIWSITGKLLHRMSHAKAITDLAFDHTGQRLITGSDDETASVWDTSTGSPLGDPLHHHAPVTAVGFDPASARAATASQDGIVQLWDSLTGRPITEPLVHDKDVTCVVFSHDGKFLFSGSRDRTVRIWDLTAQTKDRAGLVRFARAICPVELQASGRTAIHSMASLTELEVSQNYSGANSLAEWFFDQTAHRRLTPFAAINLDSFIKNRLQENSHASEEEAHFYQSEKATP